MNIKIPLLTDRLKIKTLEVGDIIREYVLGLNDPEVNKFLVNVRLKRQTHQTVYNFVKMNLIANDSILFGIFIKDKDINKLIGTIRIHDISQYHYLCSLGICIFDKNYWGKGYGLEALKKVVEFVFTALKLHYIEAGVYKENLLSMKLFRKAGFNIKAKYKNKYRYIDSFKEVVIFAKTNTNFNILKCKDK